MDIFINIIGLLLIAFIIIWFWVTKPKAMMYNQGLIRITVKDGVYNPARIKVPANQELTLEFIRKDTSTCAQYVVFNSLNIQEQLPLGKPYKIKIKPLQAGTYPFGCQMNMYRGELVVNAR